MIKLLKKLTYPLTAISLTLMTIAIGFFIFINDGIFFSTAIISLIFLAVLIAIIVLVIVQKNKVVENKSLKIISMGSIVISIIMLTVLILKSFVIDYFQPISLSTLGAVLLVTASVFMVITACISLITHETKLLSLIVSLGLVALMSTGILWANLQQWGEFSNIIGEETYLFVDGESGYATFRIPSLVALDKDVLNEQGFDFDNDLLLAVAEGRQNSSFDTGSIDLVGKISTDQGQTWSELMVFFTYTDQEGKFGNPTIVFDCETGLLNVVYMTATADTGFDYETYNSRASLTSDLTLEWEEAIRIDTSVTSISSSANLFDAQIYNLTVGPGKGIQLENQENESLNGRLIIPASYSGSSYSLYSDDNGLTWFLSEGTDVSNENEVVEFSDGEILMVHRYAIGAATTHFEQYIRFSYSVDGGETFYETAVDSMLKTPICMTSIDVLDDDTLLVTYPNSFTTRTNLTIALSLDKAETFETKSLYAGATGYSCVCVDSDGNVYVLAELGAVNYNEALVFMQVDILC